MAQAIAVLWVAWITPSHVWLDVSRHCPWIAPDIYFCISALALLACDAGWLYNPLICAVGMSRFIAHQFGIHPVHAVISTFVFFTCNDGFLLSAHYCVAFCHGLSYLNCKTSLFCVSGIKFIRLWYEMAHSPIICAACGPCYRCYMGPLHHSITWLDYCPRIAPYPLMMRYGCISPSSGRLVVTG